MNELRAQTSPCERCGLLSPPQRGDARCHLDNGVLQFKVKQMHGGRPVLSVAPSNIQDLQVHMQA